MRRMMKKIISSRGYVTLDAANGDEAIKVFDEPRKGVNEKSMDFLKKPLSVEKLLSKVREVLER